MGLCDRDSVPDSRHLDRGLSRRTSCNAAQIRAYQTDAPSKRPLRYPTERANTPITAGRSLKAASISAPSSHQVTTPERGEHVISHTRAAR